MKEIKYQHQQLPMLKILPELQVTITGGVAISYRVDRLFMKETGYMYERSPAVTYYSCVLSVWRTLRNARRVPYADW